jgi:hypothetical protein
MPSVYHIKSAGARAALVHENVGVSLRPRRWQAEPPSAAPRRELSDPQMDVAARHYEGHALEHRHVVERARIDRDHIGGFA